jgi:hypothetical protein
MLAAGAAAAPLALAASALSGSPDPDPVLVVSDQQGDEIVTTQLPESGSFALAYRHSYYGAPARERFTASGSGFRLREIASPRAAVLDYYALDGERRRRGRWWRLAPAEGRRYELLPLIATATGRRTLLVGGERIPLYGREARHVTITMEGER